MKLLKSIFAIMLIATVTTSCDKNEEVYEPHENYLEQDYTGCFNYIYKKSVEAGTISIGTTYKFRWRADNTADIYVYNAKFSAMMPDGINITFEGLEWKEVDGVKKITLTDVIPTAVTMNGETVDASTYVIDALNLSVIERRMEDTYIPVINMSMTMGGVEVVTIQQRRMYFGSTMVTNNMASTNYTSESSYYLVTLNPLTKQATIDIYQAKFAEMMPAMDMKFSEIPFELSNMGYTLACEELIPTIKEGNNDVPYDEYKITNLSGVGQYDTGMDLNFDCRGVFTVQANLKY